MHDSPAPPADLDLRLLRCFVVVAEHRHFGRAAETLHTTQPSLSRQIRRLEQQVGARLLDRGRRGSRLTEAGEAFLPLADGLLGAAARAAATARAAARPSRITIGYTRGLYITPAVRELRHRNPEAEVRTLNVDWNEPDKALLDHRVDAVVARLPFPTDRLHVTVLYDEPRYLVVSRDHRLAGKETVTLDDIADEPVPRVRQSSPVWGAFWRIDPRPDGRPAPGGPLVEAVEDKFEAIAAGEAVGILPSRHATRHPDLTTIALEGVEPCHVALATRAGDRNRLVAAFRDHAQTHLTGAADQRPDD
ncbi:LysR family transcriptional regulator [Actinomadura napierensis]|uniref:LysR family transcriptional regulator n=1 Tax=Actinomadura napierensis TaxID=267854 RepID=A0ABP5KXK9_9ACTN